MEKNRNNGCSVIIKYFTRHMKSSYNKLLGLWMLSSSPSNMLKQNHMQEYPMEKGKIGNGGAKEWRANSSWGEKEIELQQGVLPTSQRSEDLGQRDEASLSEAMMVRQNQSNNSSSTDDVFAVQQGMEVK